MQAEALQRYTKHHMVSKKKKHMYSHMDQK